MIISPKNCQFGSKIWIRPDEAAAFLVNTAPKCSSGMRMEPWTRERLRYFYLTNSDCTPSVLWPDRGCRQYSNWHLQGWFPDSGGHSNLGRLSGGDSKRADSLARRIYHSAQQARVGGRTGQSDRRQAPVCRHPASSWDGGWTGSVIVFIVILHLKLTKFLPFMPIQTSPVRL